MAKSEYDSDGDGRCDAPVCRGTREPYGDVARAVRDDLQGIGIFLNVEVLDSESFFGAYADPRQKVPLFVGIGWTKSYISAASFFYDQFYGPAVLAEDFGNGTLVGATTDLLRARGYDEGLEAASIGAPERDPRPPSPDPLRGRPRRPTGSPRERDVSARGGPRRQEAGRATDPTPPARL